MPTVGLMTDSTWSLDEPVHVPFSVVPLHVHAGAVCVADTPENRDRITELLAKAPTTSQPAPAEIRGAFDELRLAGVERIIAVHISSRLSGTCAAVAALGDAFREETGVRVDVVDSRAFGAGTGFGVLAAARLLTGGGSADEAIAAARRVAAGAAATLVPTDLHHLQRGGRLRLRQAILGQALGVRPLLTLHDGSVEVATTARGARKLREALLTRVIEEAGHQQRAHGGVDLAVQHTAGAEGVDEVAATILEALADAGVEVGTVHRGEVSGVLMAHGGPGAYVVVTAPKG